MKRSLAAALFIVTAITACADQDSDSPLSPAFSSSSIGEARVTNNHDAGPGSFRAAVNEANTDPTIRRIEFKPRLGTIALLSPVVYTGTQALAIDASRAVIDGQGMGPGASVFVANGGGDLEVNALTVKRAPGIGITVAVPATATGTVRVTLLGVDVNNNGSHGVLINDQAQYFVDPNSLSPDGSAASLDVVVAASSFEKNGFTDLDQDGLRINEGGAGNLRATITASKVEGNGGDGVELDERGAGDVLANAVGVTIHTNGSFSSADFDDGIDIDESGDGSIIGAFLLCSANGNYEQGFDLNENDAGDLRVDMTLVEANNNAEEGIEYEEDDDFAGGGDIVANLTGIKTRGNGAADGDAALKLREKGAGNLTARLTAIESSSNLIDGVLVREDADGNLSARITGATTNGNTGDGIEFDENSTGNLDATLERSTSSSNTGAGIRADQATPGTGTLQLRAVTLTGNAGGPVVANSGVTVTQTP